MIEQNFEGTVYPVNPNREKVQGLKNKNFYYGALPPGILAAQAANQQQSLLE